MQRPHLLQPGTPAAEAVTAGGASQHPALQGAHRDEAQGVAGNAFGSQSSREALSLQVGIHPVGICLRRSQRHAGAAGCEHPSMRNRPIGDAPCMPRPRAPQAMSACFPPPQTLRGPNTIARPCAPAWPSSFAKTMVQQYSSELSPTCLRNSANVQRACEHAN